jgi:hypothetical protein
MNHLQQYYRNLCEQLQEQIAILEKKIEATKKKAKKDYDGDGEIETSEEEYMGSKDKAIKKSMAEKKKKSLKEGRVIGDGNFMYGGFPKTLNEARYNIPAKVSDINMEDPTQVGMDEFEKLMKAGSHPIMAGQTVSGKRGVPPEIRKEALQHIEVLKKHPRGPIKDWSSDHPVYQEGKKAYDFFKKNFPEFGVEDQIGEDYGIEGHSPFESKE